MYDRIYDSWVAGFWEGEGSLFSQDNRYNISIAQSVDEDRDVIKMMNKLKDTYGGHITFSKIKKYKDRYMWRISKGKDVIKFVKRIYPYCQFRRTQLSNFLIYAEKNPQHFTKFKKINIIKAKELRKKGLTYAKIGTMLNECPSTIWKRINLYA